MRGFAVLFVSLVVACGGATATGSGHGSGSADGVQPDASDDEVDAAEAAWSRRLSSEDAARAIEIWSARVRADEDDAASWIRLAQAEHFVASVHAPDSNASLQHAQAGLDAAIKALELLAPDRAAAIAHHTAYADVSPNAAPALYWYARNQAAVASASGYADTLLVRDDVMRALSACERVAPDYDHHGATVQLAKALARPSDASQRDLVNARKLIDRAIAAEPNYLPHHVALAEAIGIVGNDRALFERELGLARDASLAANANAEQHLAQARAQTLLAQVDELFE